MSHFVYELYDRNDNLLYVGATAHPDFRVRTHKAWQPWGDKIHHVKTNEFLTESDALAEESKRIVDKAPCYNRTGNTANREQWKRKRLSWLSTREACQILGITNRTLYSLIDAGEITAYKFGRVIRLKEADVESFLDASRVLPGSLSHLYPAHHGGEK